MTSSSASRPTVAAFDFDKTLSSRDNVLPFLTAVAGRGAVLRALAATLPDVARGRRNDVKARLTRLLAGRDAAALDVIAADFAADVLAHHLRDDVVARAAWHGAQGHRRVIVSASYECYLRPIATALGFDAALGTRLELVDGLLSGRLDGRNMRRAEKVRRLDEWLDWLHGQHVEEDVTLWAYGDSGGDRELFARADHVVRVEGRVRLDAAPPDSDVAT